MSLRWTRRFPHNNVTLSNVEVYEYKNGNITYKENAASYDHYQFDDQAPLFLVDANFCTAVEENADKK